MVFLVRLLSAYVLAAWAMAGAGCGPDGSNLVRCDIRGLECQEAIYLSVAEFLELESMAAPSIRVISVDEYERELRAGVAMQEDSEDPLVTRGLKLIGFLPEAFGSQQEADVERLLAEVAAYYSTRDKAITVIDRDYGGANAQTLLAHEFVHALQDAQVGLASIGDEATTTDEWIAVRSVVEGDASYVQWAWSAQEFGFTPTPQQWDDIHAEREALAMMEAADPTVPVTDSEFIFPYAFGFRFMTDAVLFDGLAERERWLRSPPASAWAFLWGYEPGVGEGFVALSRPDEAHPAVPAPYTEFGTDSLGAWYLFAFLQRLGVPESEAMDNALDWVGDRFAFYDDGASVSVVWRIRYGVGSGASATRTMQAVLDASSDVPWTAVTAERDVYVIATEDEDSLDDWLSF